MKRFTIIFTLLLLSQVLYAKTTYIPHYNSYIHLESADGHILNEQSLKCSTSLTDESGTFRFSIIHEEMTIDKVKSIKRAKNAAGWQAASAILSSVAALSNGSRKTFQKRLSIATDELCVELADMYAKNAQAEKVLAIGVVFENLSDHEMMLHDMERGLVWFVRPGKNFVIQLNNPDALLLRISDAKDVTANVHYATLAAGNSVEKVVVAFENEEYMLSFQKGSTDGMYVPAVGEEDKYWYIDKVDFISRRIDKEEFIRLQGSK